LGDKGFEGFPGDVFRHSVGGGAIKVHLAGAVDGGAEEFDAGKVRFAEAAACYKDAEAGFALKYLALRVAEA
jgi:hypothetical protein